MRSFINDRTKQLNDNLLNYASSQRINSDVYVPETIKLQIPKTSSSFNVDDAIGGLSTFGQALWDKYKSPVNNENVEGILDYATFDKANNMRGNTFDENTLSLVANDPNKLTFLARGF